MGTCNISTQNGGGLQAQAALDASVYYYHPDHLVLVGPRNGSAIHWGPKKRSMRFWGEEEQGGASNRPAVSLRRLCDADKDQHNGGTWKRADSPKDLESRTTRDGTYDENLQRIGD